MRISVIIPSLWDVDKDYAKLCIQSLRESTKDSPHDWDVILVTNGSKDDVITRDVKGITAHLNTKDQGQCNAVNMGASIAEGQYLFIVNSDMYFAPGWDKNLRFDHLVFSPNLVEPVNNAGSAKPFHKFDGGLTLEEFKKEEVDYHIETQVTFGVDEHYGEEPGLNFPLFIRKDVWQTIGGYDTNYDPWGSNSDTDLQTRINLAGITPMRLRDVLVYHFSNKSGTFDFSQAQRQEFYNNNIEYFRNKFGFDRDELGSDVWMNKDMLPEDKSRIKFKADWIGKYAA